jgi:hypothetical protein
MGWTWAWEQTTKNLTFFYWLLKVRLARLIHGLKAGFKIMLKVRALKIKLKLFNNFILYLKAIFKLKVVR